MITDELLFYGGLILTGISAFSGLITVFLLKIRRMQLDRKFEEEYGKEYKGC